jgi:hypothetical protein
VDLPKTKIVLIDDVEGIGKVKLRVPCSAGVSLDIPDIFASTEQSQRRIAKIEMAVIADCYVDNETEQPIYDGYRDMLAKMNPMVYPQLRNAALPVINAASPKPGEAEKNSESIPDSPQPLDSQET